MGTRRKARECAMQFLFQYDLNPAENLDEALERFWESQRAHERETAPAGASPHKGESPPPPTAAESAVRLFAEPLIRGTLEHRDELDALIQKHAKNWSLHRMAVVDRNLLRLAAYEMLYREDIPPVVSINEAVDIAKKYSTDDSSKFVNGILDSLRKEILRPARQAHPAPDPARS
jgi:N utilization substance protein B